MTEDREKFADKIGKLLAKAESTTPEEAELLLQKAQELMSRYSIDEAMVAAARGLESAEKVVEERIVYTGIFREAAFDIGKALCAPNECHHLISHGGKTTTLVVIGFEGDVSRVKMLDSSIQIQARGALLKWQKDQDRTHMGSMEWYKARREFLFGFAEGLRTQLEAAHAKAVKEAKADEKPSPTSPSSSSVELVLRDKKQRVSDWIDETYGRLTTTSRRYSSGGYAARVAGHDAGRRADASGRGKVSGRTRELAS
jgi:hypothetical protein